MNFINGLSDLSFEYRKAYFTNADHKYIVSVYDNNNNDFKLLSSYELPMFGKGFGAKAEIHSHNLSDLNLKGNIIVKIHTNSKGRATFDNFKWSN